MKTIQKWVLSTFILTLLVIVAGAVVRTTQSGMGCPDWPKCFGLWVPPTNASQLPPDFEKYLKVQDIDHSFNVFHTWIEYVNRLVGALLGLFAILQVLLLLKYRTVQKRAFQLAIAFLITVILTGLFGAIVVKLNLAGVSISVHLLFALVLTQLQLALYMAVTNRLYKKTAGIKIRRVLFFMLLILLVQIALGTMVRIYVDGVSKALNYEQRDAWLSNLPVIFIMHRSFSWVVMAFVLYINWYGRKVAAVKKPLQNLLVITLLSVTTGIILYYLDMPAIAQPIHLLLATLAITQTMFAILYTKNTTNLMKPQT